MTSAQKGEWAGGILSSKVRINWTEGKDHKSIKKKFDVVYGSLISHPYFNPSAQR